MDGPFRRRYLVVDLALEAVVAVVIVVLVLLTPEAERALGSPNAVVVIDRRLEGRAIRPDSSVSHSSIRRWRRMPEPIRRPSIPCSSS